MPYERKGKCVYRKDTGKVQKCFKTTQEAQDYLIALKINVEDASKKPLQNKWGK